jgi:hypothetical protein
MFVYIIEHPGQATLPDILQFCTALWEVPPIGLDSIKVEYTENALPQAAACFNTVLIPTLHDNYTQFCAKVKPWPLWFIVTSNSIQSFSKC